MTHDYSQTCMWCYMCVLVYICVCVCMYSPSWMCCGVPPSLLCVFTHVMSPFHFFLLHCERVEGLPLVVCIVVDLFKSKGIYLIFSPYISTFNSRDPKHPESGLPRELFFYDFSKRHLGSKVPQTVTRLCVPLFNENSIFAAYNVNRISSHDSNYLLEKS